MIVVTGASGVIGTALLAELRAQQSDSVVGISSADADLRSIDKTVALFAALKPTVIYHLAARVYGLMGNKVNKAASYLDNIQINTNVIEAGKLAGVRKIVAMGSTAIYSDFVPLPMREDDIWVGPPHPSEAPYAHAKRAMLVQLEAYRDDYGIDFAYCISTNLFGPHDRFDEQYGHVLPSLISKFYRAKLEGSSVAVWGSGVSRRDFLFSEDAARALRMIGEAYSGAINVATGVSHSIAEAAASLQEVSGFKGEVVWDTTKPEGQKVRQYDVSRLQSLGFEPKYSLTDGLRKTFEWYAESFPHVRR